MRRTTGRGAIVVAALLGAASARAVVIENAAQPALRIGSDGLGVFAYHDNVDGFVKLAHCDDAACSAVTVRTIDFVGLPEATLLYHAGADVAIGANGPVVSYLDLANGDLKIALCGDPTCATVTTAVLDPDAGDGSEAGTAVVIGSDGLPLVGYALGRPFFPTRGVRVAHCDAADCSARTVTDVGLTEGRSVALVVGGDGLGALMYTGGGIGVQYGIVFKHCANVACTAFSSAPLVEAPRDRVLLPPGPIDYFPAAVVGADGFVRYAAVFDTVAEPTRIRVTRCLDFLCALSLAEEVPDGLGASSPVFGPDGRLRIALNVGLDLRIAQCLDSGCASVQQTCEAALAESPSLARDASGLLLAYQRGSRVEIVRPGTSTACATSLVVKDPRSTEDLGPLRFAVGVWPPPTSNLVVSYQTTGGTATPGVDYTPVAGQLTFQPGLPTSLAVDVPLTADALDEPDETVGFAVTAAGVLVADGAASGRIVDDDLPALSVSDCTVTEGESRQTGCSLAVTLSSLPVPAATVAFATVAGTATAGTDFLPVSGALTFAPGALSQTVSVLVLGDTGVELDETLRLVLSNPVNASLADGSGDGTIRDDDAPSLSTVELAHGSRITADLAGGVDDYRVAQQPHSSYELVADAVSGDIAPGLVLERLAEDNQTVRQIALPGGTGGAVSLRWARTWQPFETRETLRVRSTACTTDCGADDAYRLRLYDTTASVARFNNAGDQVTVLILHNLTELDQIVHITYWDAAGNRILPGPSPLGIDRHQTAVINTADVPGLAGRSGSITIAHETGYGGLVGKAVSLEPATGLAFDTPLEYRAR